MADWTNIPNTALQPGAPARSIDALALRDNPVAIAEGAAGAPRVQTAGINDGAVTNAKIANRTIRGIKLMGITDAPVVSVSAGENSADVGTVQVLGNTSTTGTGFQTAHTYTINKYTGSLRFRFTHRGSSVAVPYGFDRNSRSEARILKNGTVLATWSSAFGGTPSTRSLDVSVAPGDVIVIQHRRRDGSVEPVFIGSFFVGASNPYVEVVAVDLRSNIV